MSSGLLTISFARGKYDYYMKIVILESALQQQVLGSADLYYSSQCLVTKHRNEKQQALAMRCFQFLQFCETPSSVTIPRTSAAISCI